MTPETARRARLEELLGIEATQGLSPSEANELDALLDLFADEDPDSFERAAAAVHLALSPPPEEMPAALAERLHLAAIAFAPSPASPRARRARPAWVMWSGWAVAAGLAGVLIYAKWLKTPEGNQGIDWVRIFEAGRRDAFAEIAAAGVPVRQARDKLRGDRDAKAVTFLGDKKTVSGNIVWSDAKQEGYLEVRGLPPIDPGAGTYQLWIVDAGRKDPQHGQPIDGGVFKVKPDGTALVSIRAPIQVKNAAAFAITRETEPGGVVVSSVKPENYELVLAPKKG
jgi:hypothetical protein